MADHKSAILLSFIASLALGAVAILTVDLYSDSGYDRAREFQTLVGGIGLGPALDLVSCEFSFDPRLSDSCPADQGPIPGGIYFCPHHAFSILFHRVPCERNQLDQAETMRDAQVH